MKNISFYNGNVKEAENCENENGRKRLHGKFTSQFCFSSIPLDISFDFHFMVNSSNSTILLVHRSHSTFVTSKIWRLCCYCLVWVLLKLEWNLILDQKQHTFTTRLLMMMMMTGWIFMYGAVKKKKSFSWCGARCVKDAKFNNWKMCVW